MSVFARHLVAAQPKSVGGLGYAAKASAPGSAGSVSGVPGAAGKVSSVIAAPVSKAKGKAKAKAKVSAGGDRCSRAQGAGTAGNSDDEEGGGGVMTCANRGLLQQMFSSMGNEDAVDNDLHSDDEEDDEAVGTALSMSQRLRPGTPQTLVQRRDVVTIRSPVASRPKQISVAASGRLSAAVPVAPNPFRQPGFVASMVAEGASTPLPAEASGRPAVATQNIVVRALVAAQSPAQIVTGGLPSATYVSAPRPGSRGASMPQPFTMPSGRQGNLVRKVSGSYGQLHAAKATGTPLQRPDTGGAVAKKPLCGPSAFEMLRKLEMQRSLSFDERLDSQQPGQVDRLVCDDDEDDEGFVMPPASEDDDDDAFIGRPAIGAVAGVAAPSKCSIESAPPQHRVLPSASSGAEGLVAARPSPPRPDSVASAGSVSSSVPPARARSSDPRTPAAPASLGVVGAPRVRSCDPRAAVAASRAACGGGDESDSSDDEHPGRSGQGGGGGGGSGGVVQWKADVRNMVQEFAREERTRGGRDADAFPQRRPPRAPALKALPVAEEPPTAQKKPPRRDIDYTPATLDEYKQKFGAKGEKQQLGSLGPDLDDESVMMKRAVQEKVKQFSKELHRINRQRVLTNQAQPKQPQPKVEPKPTARAKALEFAQNVPKPKPVARPSLLVECKSPTAVAADARQRRHGTASEEEQDDMAELRRREKQHFEDVAKVLQIKAFLAQLAV